MNRRVAKVFGDLGEIHPVRTNHFLGCIYFHVRKIFNDPQSAAVFEEFLELGASDDIVAADLLNGHVAVQVRLQVGDDLAEGLHIIFLFGAFQGFQRRFPAGGGAALCAPGSDGSGNIPDSAGSSAGRRICPGSLRACSGDRDRPAGRQSTTWLRR